MLDVVSSTIGELKYMLDCVYGAIYVGSTGRTASERAYEHQRRYTGTLYYAHTQNMQSTEDKLLKIRYTHNRQRLSNAQPIPGYVYIIVGRKRS